MSNCQSVLSSCTGWVLRVYNITLSKPIDFSSKITFANCMEYGLEKVSKATSTELIRGIIAGPNMKYKCIEANQSKYVCTVMQDNLIDVCQKTKHKIFFMEAHNGDKFDGLLTVTLKPKSQKSTEHLVLWGCICFTMETVPVVGFAHGFDITGRGLLFVYILHYMWCLKIINIHCTQVAIEWDFNKTNVDQN